MKRVGQLLASIADLGNLLLAVWKAAKGKRPKADCRAFQERLDTNLKTLRDDLLAGHVRAGDYHCFTIGIRRGCPGCHPVPGTGCFGANGG